MNPYEHLPTFPPKHLILENFSNETPLDEEKLPIEQIYHNSSDFKFPLDVNAPKFSEHPHLHENALLHEEFEKQKQLAALKSFFRSGDIEAITNFILEEQVENLTFKIETERIKNAYAKDLASATFLTPMDWRLLTAIELFDKATFEHSIGTYLIVKKAIEEELPEFRLDVSKEGVHLEQLYRGALLHDCGKMAIPLSILNRKTSDDQWVMHLTELNEETKDEIFVKIYDDHKIVVPEGIRNDLEKMTHFFKENRIRAVKYVPVGSILSDNQKSELEAMKLSAQEKAELLQNEDGSLQAITDLPLGKIIEIHEKRSEEILEKLGCFVEALLAGHHHNYKYQHKKLGEKPTSLTLTYISIETSSNIIHFADVQRAMSESRPYQLKNPTLRILAFLADAADANIIDSEKTAKWIFKELKKMNPAYLRETRNLLAKRQHHQYMLERQKELEKIDEFLYDNLPEDYSLPNNHEQHFALAA